MSLKDVFSLIDDKLADVFHAQKYDPAKDREKLIKRLEGTKTKFLQTEPVKGRKDFSVSNNVVEFRPTLPNGAALTLNGRDVAYVPSERFENVIDKLIAAVRAGEIDDQLEGKEAAKRSTTKAPRKPRSDAGSGWSDERRAKFEATMAARKAATKK